jgi:ATP-dependent helicase/nuclease subunit A
VDAGAGTGKTNTVVGRVLYLLGVPLCGQTISRPVPLDRIAAITFTNAAAADLKKRLRQALRAAGRREEAFQVDTARIGTIHGFAGDLLREFALRSHCSPAGAILEEAESALLTAEVVRATLITAVAEERIPGLADLLAAAGVEAVSEWVERLLGESDRLANLRSQRERFGPREQILLELAGQTLAALSARLQEMGAMDFDRMIVWTRDLLRDDQVRRLLQHRIHTLIVDEFQDVDPVQRELAYLLGEPEQRRSDTTRLLLVGDPKQSIYRFRRADVTVWASVERDFVRGQLGKQVILETNYRSMAPLLGFVDTVIGPILDAPLDGTALTDCEVPFRSVNATRSDGPTDRAVELILHADAGEAEEKASADDRRRQEAAIIARRARECSTERGGRWGGMAVLLGGWGSVKIYEEALQAVGAPTYTLFQDGFYRRQEVVDILVALEAIRDPRNDVALFGFLRGPCVGLRDETLLQVALSGPAPRWDRRGQWTVQESERLAWGVALLDELGRLRDRIPTADLIERLLERSGYLAHLALLGDDGRQPIANLRKLVRMARGMAHAGVGDFVRMLRTARDGGRYEGDARLFGEKDDVVTLTSIHSAKGLQWDVVFWADLSRQPQGDRSGGLILTRDAMLIEVDDSDAGEMLRSVVAREEQAERKRLWYVAATRARDRLIVSGLGLKMAPKGSPAASLGPILQEKLAGTTGTFRYAGQGGEFTGLVHLTEPLATPRRELAPRPVGDPASILTRPLAPLPLPIGRPRHSATEFLCYARCPMRHYFKYVAGVREPAVAAPAGVREQAILRGLIVHDVLEHLREEAELDLLLEDAIGRRDRDAPPPDSLAGQQYRDRIRAEVRGATEAEEYRALAARPGARHELPFLHLGPAGERIQGKIDLAAPEGRGIVLLDVKTGGGGGLSPAERAARYAPQRDIYLSAAEAISGLPVERFAWQFSWDGVQVSEPVTAALRGSASAAAARTAEEIGRGTPALTSYPGECRFCGYQQAGWCTGVAG